MADHMHQVVDVGDLTLYIDGNHHVVAAVRRDAGIAEILDGRWRWWRPQGDGVASSPEAAASCAGLSGLRLGEARLNRKRPR